jgi:hypothetical protein
MGIFRRCFLSRGLEKEGGGEGWEEWRLGEADSGLGE